MSDPRINPPRPAEPPKSNSIYYIVGGLVVAVLIGYWLMSRGSSDIVGTTGDDNSVTIVAPATDPAPADPVVPPAADPVVPPAADPVVPPAADPVIPPATDPVVPPATDPAAPAPNP